MLRAGHGARAGKVAAPSLALQAPLALSLPNPQRPLATSTVLIMPSTLKPSRPQTLAQDCTFFWSRWTRYLCCPAMPLLSRADSYGDYDRDRSKAIAQGERQSLIAGASPPAPIPQSIEGQASSDRLSDGSIS